MSQRAPLLMKLDGQGPLVIHELRKLTDRDPEFRIARTVETQVEVKTLA